VILKNNATLKTESKNPNAVAKALSVDNRNLSEQTITTTVQEGHVETKIECESLRTMLASIDDLIRSQMIAESVT